VGITLANTISVESKVVDSYEQVGGGGGGGGEGMD